MFNAQCRIYSFATSIIARCALCVVHYKLKIVQSADAGGQHGAFKNADRTKNGSVRAENAVIARFGRDVLGGEQHNGILNLEDRNYLFNLKILQVGVESSSTSATYAYATDFS